MLDLFSILFDRWSLWHAAYGFGAAEFNLTPARTLAIAFAWEWFEWSGAAGLLGLGRFHLGPDSGGLLNSLGDVALALAMCYLGRAYARHVRKEPVPK